MENKRNTINRGIDSYERRYKELMRDSVNAYFGMYGKTNKLSLMFNPLAMFSVFFANLRFLPRSAITALSDFFKPRTIR